jgi:two-component system sensor histidine kinase DesK
MLGAAGIDCRIENEAGLLPKEIDGVLAWAVREGTTNVIRHSKAQNCRIVLAREEDKCYAEITDDGRGGTNEETSGSGLSGLAERVARFGGGEFEAGLLPGGGFRLRVDLPLGRAEIR